MAVNIKFLEFQQIQFDLFKSQDPEIGCFDIVFEVEGKKLYGYQSMLPVISSTFKSMLSDRWNKNKDVPIKVKDYSFNDFYQFLTFLYSAQCELTDKNIFVMVDIAEFYQVSLFKDYCDEYLSKTEFSIDNVLEFLDLVTRYSLIQLKDPVKDFIVKNFVNIKNANNFLNVKKDIFAEIVDNIKDEIRPEDLFQFVYKWAEKQAMDKQAFDQNFNQNDAIKNEISEFLPFIDFAQMEHKFVIEFVVPRGFIFSSYDDLSKFLKNTFFKHEYKGKKVTVINERGQRLHGNVIPDKTVIEMIISLKNHKSYFGNFVYWVTKNKILAATSSLKKRIGVEWYLIRVMDGYIGLVHSTMIHESCFVLAEMTADKMTGFSFTDYCEIQIE